VSKRIFISYSHKDTKWRRALEEALAPYARSAEIGVWDDSEIATGEDWAGAIEAGIQRADVAVLLVSAAFLASEYVAEVELPRLVAAAKTGRLSLVWLPVSAGAWEVTPLVDFQAAIDPKQPLDRMSPARRAEALVKIARTIAGARTLTDVANAMHVIDGAYEQLSDRVGPPRVSAHHSGQSVAFIERGSHREVEVITAADLEFLPKDQHELVRALREGMTEEYERWTTLRPRRATLTAREQAEYERSGQIMCQELQNLLDFLEQELHKSLEDHYHGIRFACRQLVSGVES